MIKRKQIFIMFLTIFSIITLFNTVNAADITLFEHKDGDEITLNDLQTKSNHLYCLDHTKSQRSSGKKYDKVGSLDIKTTTDDDGKVAFELTWHYKKENGEKDSVTKTITKEWTDKENEDTTYMIWGRMAWLMNRHSYY